MKKIFSILAVALVAFSFASCDKKNDPDAPGSFTITVSAITSNSATVAIEPSNANAAYFWNVFSTEAVNYYGGADSLLALYIEYYKEEGYTYADLVKGLLIIEAGKDSYDYTGLDPETDYTVIACYIDTTLQLKGKATTKAFKTSEFVVTGSETLNLAEAEYAWEYYTDYSLGLLQVYAYDQAKDMEFGMAVYTGQTPNGTFTVEDIYEPYVDYGYTNYYNYLYSENSALDLSFVEMNVTGALNADGTYTFGGDVVASNGIKYAFSNVVATEFQDEEGGDVAAAPAKKAVSKVAIKKAIRDLKVKKLAVRK